MAAVLHRSDGTIKVYGLNKQGKLLTVVMVPNDCGAHDIAEVKLAGKVTASKTGVRL